MILILSGELAVSEIKRRYYFHTRGNDNDCIKNLVNKVIVYFFFANER
jgi:hypothetical protein